MKRARIICLIVGLLALLALSSHATASHSKGKGFSQSLSSGSGPQEYTLEFRPTANAPGAQGTITIKTGEGATVVHFQVRGAYPNTVYTIWIVYKQLTWPLPTNPGEVPSGPVRAKDSSGRSFPTEGNGVAPLARLDSAFTSGMGLDPGLVFVTNNNGDGEAQVKLDYNLIWHSPVGNQDIIFQCVPGPLAYDPKKDPPCLDGTKKVFVTTTWLRKYIAQIKAEGKDPADPTDGCANYDASFEPKIQYWQCVDPITGLPRVPRFEFDHFRLANHPDDLTHGFIGGNGIDHWIDMVGRRCDLVPSVGAVCP